MNFISTIWYNTLWHGDNFITYDTEFEWMMVLDFCNTNALGFNERTYAVADSALLAREHVNVLKSSSRAISNHSPVVVTVITLLLWAKPSFLLFNANHSLNACDEIINSVQSHANHCLPNQTSRQSTFSLCFIISIFLTKLLDI